jgi:hypothetical protein
MVTATIVLARLGPQHRDHEDREHEAGHGHDEVHHAAHHHIDHATEPRRRKAQRDADHERHRHHRDADEERHARAVQQAGEHVAAEAIRAQDEAPRSPVGPHGRHAHGVAKLLRGRIRRDDIGEEGQRDDRGDDPEAQERAAILAIGDPEGARSRQRGRIRRGRDQRRFSRHGGCAG